ncbi:ATP-binding protein [Ornithinimicrobium sufpigmenti]|uniref:ATP-binding protein n=1 Tax=Ornithinimicrobium sufpigmenti TaxID=2508882 RepID=UPI0010365DB9|nr:MULTISPECIES: tetratricopeptide repeat protein [unclassified Ornithinimicrobium]
MQHQALGGGSELRHLHGREAELTELTELVVSHPLVTLAGPGGVGKSSLAEAVAAHAEPVFPDGVLMVRLAEVRAGAVLDAVSSAVELPRTGGGDRAEALARWLRPRRALLVVDNCEHLVEEVVEVLTHLLAEPRREGCLHVLTTSRRTLGLPLEQVLPVLPLALPGPQDPPEAVAATPSASLFLERVRGRDRSFVVPTGQWSAVGELCRRLDGLPLALELAAGRASVLGIPRLLARLETGLGVVSQQHLDGSGRVRTIEAVYDWSEQLLSEQARALLRGLSVFTGSFDIAAVDAVLGTTGAIGEWDDALSELVETSLVVREHRHDRYRLLETVRQRASERWDDEQAQAQIRRKHAEHYLTAAIRAGEGFKSGPERDWLEGLISDEPNLRVALAQALRRGDADGDLAVQGLAAAANLPLYWWTRGQHREGFDWLRSALDTVGEAAPVELRGAALFGMAFLWAHDGDDWLTAATYCREAVDLLGGPRAEPGETPILGYLLCLLGEAHGFAGETELAVTLTGRGRDLIARYPDPWGLAFAEWNVGFAHQCAGEPETAERHYREMVQIQSEHGSRLELMIGHNSLGELAERRGDHETARDHYARGLELRRNLGAIRLGYAHGSLPLSLLALARVSRALGDADTARTYAQQGHAAAAQMQDQQTVLACARELELLDAGPETATLRRQGTGWVVRLGDESTVLADSKGLRHLHTLLTRPEQPVRATTLAGLVDGAEPAGGDAGPLLDRQAVAAYRARLGALDADIDEATEDGDETRLRTAQDERDALVAELARATGLGGRLRVDKSDAERARINVTRTVRDAIERIGTDCPRLTEHLRSSVRTGTWCAYHPTTPVIWTTSGADTSP